MRYRSSLLHFAKLYLKIEGFIQDWHDEEMKKTPFWNLFKAYRDGHVTYEFCKKIDTDVAKIVKQYNKDMKFFVFGDIYTRLTPSDIAAILGLPNMGSILKHTAATFDCLFNSLHRAVNPSSVNGCVVALLFWACEKTGLCNKIAGRENICPSFLRWSMTDFHEKLIVIDLATMKV
ncbi:hypothetical protein TB2_019604 [Malus domestica]